MADLMLTCDVCRHRMRVSEYQLGMEIVCPNCKAELTIAEENTVALEPKEPVQEYEPFAAKTEQEQERREGGVERCERCNAAIRGDWDRYETDAGVWCHRCVNRVRTDEDDDVRVLRRGGASAMAAATASPASEGPEYVVPDGVNDTPLSRDDILRQHTEKARAEWEAKQPKDERPAFMRKHPRASKAILWALVAFVFLSTAYYFFVVPESGTQIVERESDVVQAMSRVPMGIRVGLNMAFWFLAAVGPLYVTLYIVEKLPTGSIIPDLVHVTGVSILLMLVSMITIVPLLGLLVYIFITALLLWSIYEMNLSDFITWLLFAFLIRYLVLTPLESRIVYSIAQATG